VPCTKCPNGKWKLGSGKCMYESKEKCESAWKAARAKKHSSSQHQPVDDTVYAERVRERYRRFVGERYE